MTTLIERTTGLSLLALAALPVLALASSAWAGEVGLKVGDLSQPDQAAAFNHSLQAAEKRICTSFPLDAHYTMNVRNCTESVHDEAMIQLTPAQRDQLAAYDNGQVRVAGTARGAGANR
jgi:UrcA family protein